MGTSTNFKIESYKDIKNYIHNDLGFTKDEVKSIIEKTLAELVRKEIIKILNDETRLRILINDCISREISNQSKERRCYMHSMMDDIYKKIDEEIHKQVTDRLLITLKEPKEDILESQV